MVGELATGCFAADTFINTSNVGNVSPNDVFQMAPAKYMLERKLYEQKWSPGPSDHLYTTPFVLATDDISDTNALWVVGRGLPPLTTVAWRWTVVVEGTAKRLSGLATSANNVRVGTATTATNVAAKLHDHNPKWAASAKKVGGEVLSSIARGAMQGAMDSYANSRQGRNTDIGRFERSLPIIEDMETGLLLEAL